MTTPMATIADALIEFILGLLGDPEAAAEFAEHPEGAFEAAGLGDICAADVRSVAPVVIDRPEVISVSPPDVTVNTPPTIVFRPPHPEEPKHELIREIANIVNNFSFDNRATILDQSVNQSIWAEGDVTQLFDQDAVVAAGDESVAGGENVDIDNSTTDIEAGDISIGNTDTDVEIEDSFNDESVDVELDLEASANDQSSTVEQDVSVEDSFNESTETTIDGSTVVNAPASTPQVEESAAAAAEPVQEVADYAAETTPDSSLDTIDSISDSPEYTDEALIEEQPLDAEFDDQP